MSNTWINYKKTRRASKKKSDDDDATEGVFDAIKALSSQVREEFEDLLKGDGGKKHFF